MDKHDIVVVGAGPAGLAVSACLRRRGLPHVVLEREAEIASAWKCHYDRLHLHTTKAFSALPFTPWPHSVPVYPSRQQVIDYFESYARIHAIEPKFGVDVTRISCFAGGFRVETMKDEFMPRFVVMAGGYNRAENRPSFPGLDHFPGSVIHARAYKNPAPYVGQRTLVVGCGNSGAEIALDLAEKGVDVSMVIRGPVHVTPRDLFGRPAQGTNIMLSRLPIAVRDVMATTVLTWAVGDLSPWGIVRPRMGPNRMIEQCGRVPILDIGTIDQIKAGKIRVCTAVEHIEGDSVVFADGSSHVFDAIILATGYQPGLHGLIDGFDAIADSRGRPHCFGEETGIQGLFFVGYRNPVTGALREMALEAPRVARAIQQAMS